MTPEELSLLSGSWQEVGPGVTLAGTACFCSLWPLFLQKPSLVISGFQRAQREDKPLRPVLYKPVSASLADVSWAKASHVVKPILNSGEVDMSF